MIRYICDICEEEQSSDICECELNIRIRGVEEHNRIHIQKLHVCSECMDIFKRHPNVEILTMEKEIMVVPPAQA
jgi:predicted amidophosphoribosyltransferase